ncbi:MAG: spermidine synthase [Thermoplasmata archaeon]|nr:MAG: spermidine synthase [Thermoplasmata archaeon]
MEALGRHVIVEFYDCSPSILNDVTHIEKSMVEAAKKAGATVINSTFHHFSPYGVSGVVVIEESHLSIHTWPEYRYASVDVFTCGESINPWISYDFLKKAFKAGHGSAMEMRRGQLDLLEKIEIETPTRDMAGRDEKFPKVSRNIWFTERDENIALSLRHVGDPLFRKQSPYQKVEIYDTYAYGRMLALDHMVMCTEKDEYAYHEMIAHVPMLTHPDPKRALIIGGGDGGVARELLRHDGLDEVVMVEIDETVIEASRKYLPSLSSAFDHPKLQLVIDDGVKYVKECNDNSFDVIIVDSNDPVGPAGGLFTEEFYKNVYRCLNENGIMITQSESPTFNSKVFKELYNCYRRIFGMNNVYCYLVFIPTYPTGMWSFSYCSKGKIHPLKDFDSEKARSFVEKHSLKYYNEKVHQAAFALPTFVKQLLDGSNTAIEDYIGQPSLIPEKFCLSSRKT